MMARIAHLSDLHFGANDPRIVGATEAWLEERQPDLIIVSGDLTQRARIPQFREASAYLNRLRAAGFPVLVVPGNHDVPLYDVFRRFVAPLRRYKRYISNDLCPWFENDEVAVLGINTARSLTIKDGRINHDQMRMLNERFSKVADKKTRILVTHHPLFALKVGAETTPAIGRQELALDAIQDAGVDMLLAGHHHHASSHDASELVTRVGSALVVQAGTATSTRVREQEQSFNTIDTAEGLATITVNGWNGEDFRPTDAKRYQSADGRWRQLKSEEPAH